MLSRFEPKSDEEFEMLERPLEAGPGSFEVFSCEEKLSSNGNKMYFLQLRVTDVNNTTKSVKDYIVLAGLGLKRLKQFLYAIGLGADYHTGMLNLNLLPRKLGLCVIGYKDGKDKQGNPAKYAEIEQYLEAAGGSNTSKKAAQAADTDPDFDDEVPF